MTKALLLCRTFEADSANSAASLDSQEAALVRDAKQRGYDYEVVREDRTSSPGNASLDELAGILDLLEKHHADVLMAVRMDRLTANSTDAASILQRSAERGWGIILSGEQIDTTADRTPRPYVDKVFAKREREQISARTREGMARRKEEGAIFGRTVDPGFFATYREVLAMVERGQSYNAVARSLNEQNVATAAGGKWYASTIKAMVDSETARRLNSREAG